MDNVFDLLDHAIEPDAWECDGDWEYRAMHWRPSSAVMRAPVDDDGTPAAARESG
jgi:hypothetical protein